jgi:hypothetical protein
MALTTIVNIFLRLLVNICKGHILVRRLSTSSDNLLEVLIILEQVAVETTA